jgi:hypothetical protein
MKITNHVRSLLIVGIIFLGFNSYGQARSGLALGYIINKPFSGDYKSGTGFALNGSIAINNKWTIAPELGYDNIKANNKSYYAPGDYYNSHINSLDLFHIGVTGRYFITDGLFAKAGPIAYVGGGNEDIATLGIGGVAGAGYNLNIDPHNSLELSFSTSLINADYNDNQILVAAFKLAYVFNFRRVD